MGHRLIIACFFVFLALTNTQAQTPEEKEIRQTYARITLGSEIAAVYTAVFDKKDFAQELANDRIEFRLSDFRVGNVADHLNDAYREFISRPNRQRQLQITPDKETFTDEVGGRQYTYRNVGARVQWSNRAPVAPIDWETMPLSHALDATQATNGTKISRFASYTVETTFQGYTQTVRATWWYGTDKNGKPTVLIGDYVNNTHAVGSFREQHMYPAIFLDHARTRNNPIVVQWLKSVAQNCPGNKHDNCYDKATGKAGISREDIERSPLVHGEGGSL